MVTQSGPQVAPAQHPRVVLESELRSLHERSGQAQRHAVQLRQSLEQTTRGIENYLDAIGQIEGALKVLDEGDK